MIFNGFMLQHYAWVERMRWHNKNQLETLALIFSEVGEATDEFIDDEITSKFGEELADIVLRVLDFMAVEQINPDKTIELLGSNATALALSYPRSATALKYLADITVDLSKAVNDCRKDKPTDILGTSLATVLLRLTALAQRYDIDLSQEVSNKIGINETRGTRGRRI